MIIPENCIVFLSNLSDKLLIVKNPIVFSLNRDTSSNCFAKTIKLNRFPNHVSTCSLLTYASNNSTRHRDLISHNLTNLMALLPYSKDDVAPQGDSADHSTHKFCFGIRFHLKKKNHKERPVKESVPSSCIKQPHKLNIVIHILFSKKYR